MLIQFKIPLVIAFAIAWLPASKISRAAEPEALRTLANGTTLCFIQVDMANVQLPKLEPLASFVPHLNELRQAVDGQTIYVAIDLPFRASSNIARFMTESAGLNQDKLAAFLERLGISDQFQEPAVQGKWTLVGSRDSSSGSDRKTRTQPSSLALDMEPWNAALQASKEFPLQITLVPPSYLRRVYAEMQPELPAVLGGGSSLVLVEGLQWLQFSIDPRTLQSNLRIQSSSPQAATQLSQQIARMLPALLESLTDSNDSAVAISQTMLGLLQLQVDGSQVVWDFHEAESTQQFLALAKLVLRATSDPLASKQSANNMKQILLAMHNYHATYNSFPPAANGRGPDGRSGLSWRVHLLPFLDEAELFNQFKLDEPWDSPHNRQLLSRMPRVFAPVTALGETSPAKPFHTVYAAPVGEKTIFGRDKPVSFSNVTDGTSNTVVVVELAPERAIPWTSPQDYEFDPEDPAAKLRSSGGVAQAGFADGSVQALGIDNAPEVWKAVFSASGGEIFDLK